MIVKALSILIILLAIITPCFAQPGGGNPPPAPISGIELLLLGGGIFGGRKAYLNFKNRK